MLRCLDGHPYDANAHEACPVCGAAPRLQAEANPPPQPQAETEAQQQSTPPPPKRRWRGPVLAALGLALLGCGWLAFEQLRPVDCRRPENADRAPCAAEGRQQREAEERARLAAEEGRKAAAARQEAESLRRGEEAQRAAADARFRSEADRAVSAFLTEPSGVVAHVRAAYAPLDPAEAEPLLDTLSPLSLAEGQLRLSRALRHGLVLTRALRAFHAGQAPRARALLTGLSKAAPPEPNRPVAYASFALGFILATAGTDPGDAAAAAFHLRTAAELGLVDAVVELLRRPNLVAAAGIDDRSAARLLDTAAIQVGQSPAVEDLYKRRNLNPMPAALLIKAFTDALAAGDWPGLIAAYKAIGERRAPLVDANMAYAVSSAPGLDGPYDRLLVMADGGAAVMHPRSRAVIGWLCETGRAGLPKDLPNAALWTALALTGMKPDDALFAELSKRYAGLKDALPPGQRALVEQVAKDIGVQ